MQVTPHLTSVRQPSFEQGELMVEVLLGLIAGESPERVTIVDPELVVRDSVARKPRAAAS